MIIRVQELERGSRETKGGAEQEGLWVRGLKMDQTGKFEDEYEKFLSEQFDSDFITIIENFGVGAELNMSFVKKGAFWNLDSVTDNKARKRGKDSSDTPKEQPEKKAEPKTAAPTAAPMSEGPIKFVSTPVQVRTTALSLAIEAIGHGIKLQTANEKFKLFPQKTTPELLAQSLQTIAESFEKFIKDVGKKKVEPKTESDEGADTPEDEIPF